MSDCVAVESIKDALAECPICTEYVHDPSRIPRRMPCCSQAICEPCLETYIKGRQKLSCPLCRQQHYLPGGVKSLPKEMVVLRFLDVLKTKKDAVPACTDCPDNNRAMAKCENCSIYLCQPCLAAHARNRMSRNHKTVTFEEIAEARSTQSSSMATQMKSQNELKLNQKLESIKTRLDALATITENINLSKMTASDEINKAFDCLFGELQQRKGILLSQVESNANKELKSVTRAEESHKTLQQKLQQSKGHLSSGSYKAMLDESPEDVDYDRRGINFLYLNLQEATSIIREVGDVRTITFTPMERPVGIDEESLCSEVSFEYNTTPKAAVVIVKEMSRIGKGVETKSSSETPLEYPMIIITIAKPLGSLLDQVIVLKGKAIICPHLEYDHSTSSEDLSFSGTVVRNTGSGPRGPNTGCRLQAGKEVLLSTPFVLRENRQEMYMVKFNIRMKKTVTGKGCNWALVSRAHTEDINGTSFGGFSLQIASCDEHDDHTNNLCCKIYYNNNLLFCEPVLTKTVGSSCDLYLAVLLDYEQKAIHVVDAAKAILLATASDVAFDEPLWTKLFHGTSTNQAVQTELLSGNKIQLSTNIMELLNTL